MTMPMFTVYFNPKDFLGRYVIRKWETLPEPKALEIIYVGDSLEGVRLFIGENYPNLTQLGRHPTDDPCIVEVWI